MWRKAAPGDALVIVQALSHLLEIIGTLDSARCLAGRLDGGQQQGDQDRDDRDNDQELNQSKTPANLNLASMPNRPALHVFSDDL